MNKLTRWAVTAHFPRSRAPSRTFVAYSPGKADACEVVHAHLRAEGYKVGLKDYTLEEPTYAGSLDLTSYRVEGDVTEGKAELVEAWEKGYAK